MKTIVFDFDGVIHSYTSGWQGYNSIPDSPVQGIKEVLKELHSEYHIAVVSSRAATPCGVLAIKKYLTDNELIEYVDMITCEKPPCVVAVDDRCICFTGDTSSLVSQIKNFKPWTDRKENNGKN